MDRVPYDGVSYYRLIQVDLNGDRKIYDPIFANITFKKPVRIMDILGNTVDMNHNGIKILIFDDGSVIKYHWHIYIYEINNNRRGERRYTIKI